MLRVHEPVVKVQLSNGCRVDEADVVRAAVFPSECNGRGVDEARGTVFLRKPNGRRVDEARGTVFLRDRGSLAR